MTKEIEDLIKEFKKGEKDNKLFFHFVEREKLYKRLIHLGMTEKELSDKGVDKH